MSQTQLKDWNTDKAAEVSAVSGDQSVRFRRLALTDFRSYGRAEMEMDGRPVVIAGENGAGKTNILEALSLIGPGRGLRGSRLHELPRIEGAGGWAVSARMSQGDDERRLGVGAMASAPERRVCRIDEQSASGPSSFVPHVRMVWLTPAQDRLFMEGAGERRRFLDRMALSHDPAHGRAASDYEKSMRQRQRLLDERSGDDQWICALEAQMAEAGVAVAAARRETAARLVSVEVGSDADLFPTADLSLEGYLETALGEMSAADVEDEYIARLAGQRNLDRDAGRALLGPHRSDLIVVHREKARAARLCSTGEQKALLIGLVLANARALAQKPAFDSGRPAPLILLLDEIAAHLDVNRRAALFDILDDIGFQSFMTGTDKGLFSSWAARAQGFTVSENKITEFDI